MSPALSYGQATYKPQTVIDVATLTGEAHIEWMSALNGRVELRVHAFCSDGISSEGKILKT